ncbi:MULTISPECIES: glycoprotease [Campylobacter]|uniref:Glycoprotease n=1 Tax=Campylobacter porcelli TaxID=1660073 RepID=A0ABU7M569_9BACT|nr:MULTISPECIES: glycoprotease [unclassified Campylobacter]MCR8696009.1 glycoprotease [Campylobacter sp. RM19073]MEE3744709.1 glycoprotease [Campylobacter sp. CX2-4855-23]MEE3776434.1 glycoprotease [Campylobacter sp. CX2-4080-23]
MVICLSSPLVIGVYFEGNLIEKIISDDKASEALGQIISDLDSRYEIDRIIYANGPGSFMGLKVAYLTLCVFCVVRNIKFYGIDGFSLNGFKPIRANKNMSFVLKDGKINLEKIEHCELELPSNLDGFDLIVDALPNYVIDAV